MIILAKTSDIKPGGMIAVKAGDLQLVVCNYDGKFYAVDRRCGHAGVFLERGTLTGYILTCPLHCAQFDIITGTALSGPVPDAPLSKYPYPADPKLHTHNIKTYPITIAGDNIQLFSQ